MAGFVQRLELESENPLIWFRSNASCCLRAQPGSCIEYLFMVFPLVLANILVEF